MMNKNLLVAAALLIVVLGGGAFVLTRGKTSVAPPSLVPYTQPAKENTALKSLKDLLLAGVSQKCTFSSTEEGSKTSGVSYIAGGKVRSDITSENEGKTANTHVIFADKTGYFWMEGQKTGYKMTFNPAEAEVTSPPGQQSQTGTKEAASEMNKSQNYNCTPQLVDSSLFNPPKDVTFTDFSSMMPSGYTVPTVSTTGAGSSCSACDSLSGEAKTQCKNALNCQ